MQIADVKRNALLLDKDAQDVAIKKLRLDPNADVVLSFLSFNIM